MLRSPFDRKAESARRQSPHEDLEAFDGDLALELAVRSVKVGRTVVLEVHPDDDSEEPRDLWHGATVRRPACLELICPAWVVPTTRAGGALVPAR